MAAPSAERAAGGADDAHAVHPVMVRGVTKVYGHGDDAVRALDGVTLDVRRGEMVALVGPSGCGKSTLLNLVGCVDLPSGGTVYVDGSATSELDDDRLTRLRRDRVGTVFQFFNLLPALRAADNVALPLVLQRVPRADIDARVADALANVGLAGKARAYPAQLSGGQLQRVAIARAVVHRPAILLADEPTGNLDSATGATVLKLLRDLAGTGQAILVATHSDDAAAICDRVVHMRDGRIV
jgi:putative ABC transport system ATP-binding protein